MCISFDLVGIISECICMLYVCVFIHNYADESIQLVTCFNAVFSICHIQNIAFIIAILAVISSKSKCNVRLVQIILILIIIFRSLFSPFPNLPMASLIHSFDHFQLIFVKVITPSDDDDGDEHCY